MSAPSFVDSFVSASRELERIKEEGKNPHLSRCIKEGTDLLLGELRRTGAPHLSAGSGVFVTLKRTEGKRKRPVTASAVEEAMRSFDPDPSQSGKSLEEAAVEHVAACLETPTLSERAVVTRKLPPEGDAPPLTGELRTVAQCVMDAMETSRAGKKKQSAAKKAASAARSEAMEETASFVSTSSVHKVARVTLGSTGGSVHLRAVESRKGAKMDIQSVGPLIQSALREERVEKGIGEAATPDSAAQLFKGGGASLRVKKALDDYKSANSVVKTDVRLVEG